MRLRYAYLLALPERVVRSLAALSGGLLRELSLVVLPARIRRTALFQTLVEVTLRFLIKQVGQVKGIYPDSNELSQNFLLQRGASHGIDLIGLLTIHVSPIWVLAALADATGAGHELIHQISEALKAEGLLAGDHPFETVEQMLDGLERTSGQLARAMNLPPVDSRSLRREWKQLKENVAAVRPELPRIEWLETAWRGLAETARAEGRSVFAVSSSIAVSALSEIPNSVSWLSRVAMVSARRAGQVLGEALIKHYIQAAEEIGAAGFLPYWQRQFRPYLRAAAEQFERSKVSSTERLLQRAGKRPDVSI